MYLLIVFSCALLLGFGILLLKVPFFQLAERTLAMLNVILESEEDDFVKQKILIRNLGRLVGSLLLFLMLVGLVLLLSSLPLLWFGHFNGETLASFDYSSWKFYTTLGVGSLLPFIAVSLQPQKSAYSDWSKLLHRMILNNYNISKSLYAFEARVLSKKTKQPNPEFVIISGLARCGTTGLTSLLYRSDRFHSLSYANLPFLLSPMLWKKVYNPKKDALKERSHGDKVMFGYNTIEALEEYFFKAFLKDSFINGLALYEHEIDEDTYQKYLYYQQRANAPKDGSTIYLSKNNNLILRYHSLRQFNPHFKAFFLFRDPLDHAYSLMKQHKRFCEMQNEDHFVLEYMDWLGHHEFGLHQKSFVFSSANGQANYPTDSINYWLGIWINYYRRLLELKDENNLFLIDYSDFLNYPDRLIKAMNNILKLDIHIPDIADFTNTNTYKGNVENDLEVESRRIFEKLASAKLQV